MEFTAQQIAAVLEGSIEGNPDIRVNNVSRIEEGKPGTLAFLANPKYTKYIYDTAASIVLVNKDLELEKEVEATLIRVRDAYESFAKLLEMYEQAIPRKSGVSKLSSIADSAKTGNDLYIGDFAVIGDGAEVGDGSSVHPQVYIGDRAKVGKNCILHPGVKLLHDCVIGDNCVIHAGTVIGSDGFGFAMEEGQNSRRKVPQVGNVVIGNDVEIGSNVSIDRATMGSTRIGNGVKMDNLIQIAHNVEVGDDSVIISQAGIAGSTKVGKQVIIAAQAGLVGHLKIGDGAIVAAQSGVTNDMKAKEIVLGSPAFDIREYRRSAAVFKKLPDLYRSLNQLEREMKEQREKGE